MRPSPRPGTREGMTAASGTARTGRHRTWDGPEQPDTLHGPGSRSPLPHHLAPVRSPQGRLRRRPRRPGSARSLTCPAPRHGHGSYRGNRRRQSRTPANSQNPAKTPLTRPHSFRDDTDLSRQDLGTNQEDGGQVTVIPGGAAPGPLMHFSCTLIGDEASRRSQCTHAGSLRVICFWDSSWGGLAAWQQKLT